MPGCGLRRPGVRAAFRLLSCVPAKTTPAACTAEQSLAEPCLLKLGTRPASCGKGRSSHGACVLQWPGVVAALRLASQVVSSPCSVKLTHDKRHALSKQRLDTGQTLCATKRGAARAISSASLVPAHCGCCGIRSSRACATSLPIIRGLRGSEGACGSLACMYKSYSCSCADASDASPGSLGGWPSLCKQRAGALLAQSAGCHACIKGKNQGCSPRAAAAGAAWCARPLFLLPARFPSRTAALHPRGACTASRHLAHLSPALCCVS